MPSQALDSGWDFGPVLDLIDSETYVASPTQSPAPQPAFPIYPRKHIKESASVQSLRLGNFAKIFEQLGISVGEPLPPVSPLEPDSEDATSSDDALPALRGQAQDVEATKIDIVKPTRPLGDCEISTNDLYAGMNKKQRQKARKKAEKGRDSNSSNEKELLQPERGMRDLKVLADTVDTEGNASHKEVSQKQARAPSRSNVGAKLRTATPVQVVSPAKMPKRPASPAAQKKQAAVVKPVDSPTKKAQPVFSQPASALVQPSMPVQIQSSLPAPRIVEAAAASPAIANSSHTSTAQHMFSTPTPVQHTTATLPPHTNGYFTPQAFGPSVHNHGLVPRTVQPVTIQRPHHPALTPQPPPFPVTPSASFRSITVRPKTDRHLRFFQQLLNNFPQDLPWLVAPMQLCNEKASTEGIHIFVDASNILIGLKDIIRRNRYPQYELSFDSLALLMERRRPTAKRIYAGSHREASQLAHITKLTETSQAVGYENIVKEQVFIQREESERRKFFKEVDRVGWYKATQKRAGNGSGSDSETGQATQSSTTYAPKWVEQGVDEILHLKMCQSIIDTEVPTTMVLATGDGAEAEHSDGFLAHVERALKKGWKVELLSWKQQTSGGYKNKKFRSKWGEQFRIIELDDYLESLIDTP